MVKICQWSRTRIQAGCAASSAGTGTGTIWIRDSTGLAKNRSCTIIHQPSARNGRPGFSLWTVAAPSSAGTENNRRANGPGRRTWTSQAKVTGVNHSDCFTDNKPGLRLNVRERLPTTDRRLHVRTCPPGARDKTGQMWRTASGVDAGPRQICGE